MLSSPSLRTETEGVADSGLRCPACEYNLTGVTEDRCPECGKPFDRQELKMMLAIGPDPIPIWDSKQSNVVVRFAQLCLMTWFLPHRLGRTFPRRYSARSAKQFRWSVVLISALPLIATMAASGELDLFKGLVMGCAYLTGVIVCEALLAAELEFFICPAESTNLHPTASESYRGLVGMFRSFVLLTCVVLGTQAGGFFGNTPFSRAAMVATTAIILWWWAALGAAIALRPGDSGAKGIAIAAMPIAVAASVLVAAVVGLIPVLVLLSMLAP